jgi:hypothetical protein
MLEEAWVRSDLPDEASARSALHGLLVRLRLTGGGLASQ